MDMNNLNIKGLIAGHKNKVFNILVILLAVYAAFFLYKKQAKVAALLAEKKNTAIKENEVLGEISKSVDLLKEYKKLLNSKKVSAVINVLSNLARGAGVQISSVKPLQEEEFPLYTKYPFDVAVTAGSYHALGKFISRLESHSDVYSVETARIAPQPVSSRGNQELRLTANLKISTILLK